MSIKKQAEGAVKWTAFASIFSAILQLLQIAILAHYLDKKDFGLMALALFVIGISQIFIDMGISNAIIHKQHVNKFQLNTLYWINVLIGIVMYGFILLTSPFIAEFYKTPELGKVLSYIGMTFLIIPFGQLFETLLRRDLKFRELSQRDIIGKIIGFLISIFLAIRHFGVYSLVYANLASAIVSTGLLILFGLSTFKPGFVFVYRSIKQKGYFSFGLFQMGEQIINYFNSQFDTLLIGKILGMEALGLYNIAKTLAYRPFQIINPIITKVAFPVFAKLQSDIEKLKYSYLKIVQSLALVSVPVYILLIIFAKPIIYIFFGSEWINAVPILQLLAVVGISISINNPIGSLQLARGRADLGFYWNLFQLVILPVTMYIGSYWGIIGVVWSIVIMRIALQIPIWRFLVKPLCFATFSEFFISFAKPLLVAVIAGFGAIIAAPFFEMPLYKLIFAGAVYMISYCVLFFFLFRLQAEELLIKTGFQKLFKIKH